MNIKNVLNEEQILLKQRDNLYLDKILIQDNLKIIDDKIANLKAEKEFLKKYQKEVISKFISNVIQVAITGAVIDIPIHLLSSNFDSIIVADYIIGGCFIYTVGILTFDLINQIRDYKNNNIIDIEYRKDIEKQHKELTSSLEKNQVLIDDTMMELDQIYEKILPYDVKVRKKEVR